MQKEVSKLIIVGDGIAGSIAAYVCAKLNIKALYLITLKVKDMSLKF